LQNVALKVAFILIIKATVKKEMKRCGARAQFRVIERELWSG